MKRPFTVEEMMKAAKESREEGYDDLAEIFESIADRLASFNEQRGVTVEEARQAMGEEAFKKLLGELGS